MRTTVTLDLDTEQIVRTRMVAEGISFSQALNDAIQHERQETRRQTHRLQPEYLQDQIDEVRADIMDAASQLVTDPGGYEEVLDELAASLQERVEAITDSVDRDAIAEAVAANTELSGREAEEAVDNAVEGAQRAAEGAGDAIDAAQAALTDAQGEVGQLVEDARQTLDDAADASARAALWAFAGLLVGAAIASFAGLWGSRLVIARTESGRVRTPDEDIYRA